MKITHVVAIFSAALISSTVAIAGPDILKPSQPNSLGLRISVEEIPVTGDYTDTTYRAFRAFRGDDLRSEDFYQQLRIIPQVKSSFADCKNEGGLTKAIKTIGKALGLGEDQAALLLLKVGIDSRWAAGESISLVPSATPTPLLMIGRGDDNLVPSARCFFNVTPVPTYPLVRYGGGGKDQEFDDYVVQFNVSGGKIVKSQLLGNLVELFTNFNTAASWDLISKDASAAALALAKGFDKAYSDVMGGPRPSSTISHTLKQGELLRITVPSVIGNSGTLVIYPRRYASVALNVNDRQISAIRILERNDLTIKNCSTQDILQNKCDKHQTIRGVLREHSDLKAIDVKLPLSIFDTTSAEKRKLIPQLCKAVKIHLRSTLGLSTLDEMMVRWAVMKDSGLEQALYDQRAATIEKDAETPIDEIRRSCWNEGDKKTVYGVAKLLKKDLVD